MLAAGAHLLVEALGCTPAVLNDAEALERLLRRAAGAIGARVVQAAFHRFSPQGVTGFLLLEESHLSLHTWPERGYAALDLFTCGAVDPEGALPALREGLGAERLEVVRVARGLLEGGAAVRVVTPSR
ncbi:MAG: adenosylmethionine decarboxylase [Polyangiales bacterium]